MDTLIESLKKAFADTFALYLKGANYHWNVEGINFPQYHSFLGDFYNEVYGSIDTFAEIIRTTGSYSPGTLQRLLSLKSINESEIIPSAQEMFIDLYSSNNFVLAKLIECYKDAEDLGEIGISNFLQDRIQAHEKHAWMLKSTMKGLV